MGFEGAGFGFGGEVEDEAFEDEEFVGGGAAEFEVGSGYEAEGSGEFAAGFVAAGLADEVFGGEGGHAEALPEDLPDGAGVADVLLGDDEHLAEGAGEHVEVADGGVFAAVGGVEEAVEEGEGAGAVLGGDGVGELVEGALLGGEDHGFDVAEGDAILSFDVEEELFELGGDEHHVGAEGVDELAGGVGVEADVAGFGGGGDPPDGVVLVDAGQLDDAAPVAEGFADALEALLVLVVHLAKVGGDAEVVGDEEDEGCGLGERK